MKYPRVIWQGNVQGASNSGPTTPLRAVVLDDKTVALESIQTDAMGQTSWRMFEAGPNRLIAAFTQVCAELGELNWLLLEADIDRGNAPPTIGNAPPTTENASPTTGNAPPTTGTT